MLSIHEIIQKHMLLHDLPSYMCEILVGCAEYVHFRMGERIFREGGEADQFYLICTGTVSLEAFVPGRGPISVQTLHEGDILGWSWLFPPYHWHFDARAVEETVAVAIDAYCVRALCESDHELSSELMQRFAGLLMQRLHAVRLQLLDLYSLPSDADRPIVAVPARTPQPGGKAR